MRVAVTTVVRHTPVGQRSGRLLLLTLGESARVDADLVLPENRFRALDPNPRGGTRGLRAVAFLDEEIVVADYCTVYRLGPDGRIRTVVEHPLMSGNHAVVPDKDGFWLVCAHADSVVRLDWSGRLQRRWRPFGLGLDLALPDDLDDYRDPRALSGFVHDTTHMNSLTVDEAGFTVTLGLALVPSALGQQRLGWFRQGAWTVPQGTWQTLHAIVRQPHDGPPRVLWGERAEDVPFHDHHVALGRIWFNDSGRCEVVGVGLDIVRIPVPGDFLRGMLAVSEQEVLVATQRPVSLHRIDLAQRRITATWVLDCDPDESITAIARRS